MKARAVIRRLPNVFLWLYYNYCAEYKKEPVDLDDLSDGLLCIRAKQKIQEIYNESE